jgi:hypothetical protein
VVEVVFPVDPYPDPEMEQVVWVLVPSVDLVSSHGMAVDLLEADCTFLVVSSYKFIS